MSDEANPRVLYVGNLEPTITEEFIITLFSQIGPCLGCKIIYESATDPYAFVEFADHSSAQMALMAMNKRNVLGKELKVNWATSPGSNAKMDTTNHFHIFVGDMSPDVDTHHLREAFAPFGEISDCKVIKDPQTNRSKGYGFICYIRKEDAEIAIASMNGQWLGGRSIRTNWANGRNNLTANPSTMKKYQSLDYDEVFNQASASNTTIYCGGIQKDLNDILMRQTFSMFGTVIDVRTFPDKGFAFVKMDSKESAARGISEVHGTEVGGFIVKCSWGKEIGGAEPSKQTPANQQNSSMNQQAAGGYCGGYGGGMGGYWGGQQQQWTQQQQQQWFQQQQQQWGQRQQWGAGYNNGGAGGYGNYGMMGGSSQQQQQWSVGNGGGGGQQGWSQR